VRPEIDISKYQFFSFFVDSERMNGMWIDFMILCVFYFYMAQFNCWFHSEAYKIMPSKKTEELMDTYMNLTGDCMSYDKELRQKQIKDTKNYLNQQLFWNRFLKSF
jgi:hypothetical protein